MYDLSLRVVAQWYYNDFGNMKKVAEKLQIGVGTVWRWLRTSSSSQQRYNKPIKLTDAVLSYLKNILIKEPTLTQVEMGLKLQSAFDVSFSRKCIATALSKINFTRKKLSKRGIASSKSKQTIKTFGASLSFDEAIVSIDEVGFDHTVIPTVGYSSKGTKCISNCIVKQRKRLSVLMAIDKQGRYFYKASYEKINSSHFAEFIKSLPWKNSKVILDNASIHKTKDVNQAFQMQNLTQLFTPPYTPECNPIENVFSVIKNRFRKLLIEYRNSLSFEEIFNRSLLSINHTDLFRSVFRNMENYVKEKTEGPKAI